MWCTILFVEIFAYILYDVVCNVTYIHIKMEQLLDVKVQFLYETCVNLHGYKEGTWSKREINVHASYNIIIREGER